MPMLDGMRPVGVGEGYGLANHGVRDLGELRERLTQVMIDLRPRHDIVRACRRATGLPILLNRPRGHY